MAKLKRCLIRGCKQAECTRGLCNDCYGCAQRAVSIGRTSWDELVALGIALKSKQIAQRYVGGSIKDTPFERAFQAKKKVSV